MHWGVCVCVFVYICGLAGVCACTPVCEGAHLSCDCSSMLVCTCKVALYCCLLSYACRIINTSFKLLVVCLSCICWIYLAFHKQFFRDTVSD